MLKRYVGLIALVLLMLVGCSTSGPKTVDNVECIVGTWERIGPGPPMYLQAFEDGTIHMSSNPDLLEVARPVVKWETRFEGTQLLIKESIGYCNSNSRVTYPHWDVREKNCDATFTALSRLPSHRPNRCHQPF